MKIRNGFVSNSSSSSFLVAFPSNPKSVNDILNMVFKNELRFVHPYGGISEHYPDDYSVKQIAEKIWKDVEKQIPNNRKQFMQHMSDVLVDKLDDFYIKEDGVYHWDQEFDYKAYSAANREVVENFMLKHNGCFFYHVIYSDDDPLGCAMEHGNLFKRLPHLTSSHH